MSIPRTCILAILILTPSYVRAENVTAEGAELTLLSKSFKFTEGPIADINGDVYFTDQPNDRIVKYSFSNNEFEDWLTPCGRSNGLYFVAPNQLIACADADNELWQIDVVDKSYNVLAKDNEGRRYNGPNDCWVNSHGGSVYFTDPLYKRPYWEHKIPESNSRDVYRVDPDGTTTRVATDLKQPNGIIGDAENQTLYVADLGDKKIYKFDIKEDGSLGDRKLFCEAGSDGMTIDEDRNVYVTNGKGVSVFDSEGKLVDNITIPRGWTANVTFAGPDRDHLFITAGDAVFTMKMRVRGIPPYHAKAK